MFQDLTRRDLGMYDEDVRDLNSLKFCILKFISEIEVYPQAVSPLNFLRVCHKV